MTYTGSCTSGEPDATVSNTEDEPNILKGQRTKTMRRAALLLIVAIVVAGPPTSAGAQGVQAFTAGTLRDACDSLVLAVRGISPIAQDDPGAMLCLGFVAGWTQAMEEVEDKTYCLPSAAESPPGDLADLIVTYVDGHPDREAAPAHEVMLEAFTDAFPCTPAVESESPQEEES